jgi:hypothetical protein
MQHLPHSYLPTPEGVSGVEGVSQGSSVPSFVNEKMRNYRPTVVICECAYTMVTLLMIKTFYIREFAFVAIWYPSPLCNYLSKLV